MDLQKYRVEVKESRSPVDGRLRFTTRRYIRPNGSVSHEEDCKPDGRLFKVTYIVDKEQTQRVVENHFVLHPNVTCAISEFGVDANNQPFERHSLYSAVGEPYVITCFYPSSAVAPQRVVVIDRRANTYSDVHYEYDEQGRAVWLKKYDVNGRLVESRDPTNDF